MTMKLRISDDLSLPGYQVSGGFRDALSSLRTAGVIIGKNTGVMRVNEDLFD